MSDDDREHIYEHVSCQSPVNVFLGLLQSGTETISPDPNIYEVPPGAIFNSNLVSFEEPDAGKVKPPKGFQDYENVCWDPQTDFGDEIFALPVEVIYSTVVKPKRRRCRPHISAMLYEDTYVGLKNVEGRTVEMSATRDVDSNSVGDVNGCSVTGNMEKHAKNGGCEAPSEHVSDRTEDFDNDVTSSGNIIDYKIDGSVVYFQNNYNDTKADDNEDSSHDLNFESSFNSSGENPLDCKVNDCVDPSVEEIIRINDNVLNACEGKILSAKIHNVGALGSNIDGVQLDKCKTDCEDDLMDTKVDQCLNSSGDADKLTEDRNCVNSYGNKSFSNRVDTFVTSFEDNESTADAQDKTVEYQDESIIIRLASSEDNAVYANVDKILSFSGDAKNHCEKQTTIIISGDSSTNGGAAEEKFSLSNAISPPLSGESPQSPAISDNNLDNESESKMSDISQIDCTVIEDVDLEGASVIEISEDGTWETKRVPPAELSQVRQEDQSHTAEEPEFLCAVDRSVESVVTNYGSHYYVNCPVASVKPMKQESAAVRGDGMPRNIGAQIMEHYDEKMQKIRENLPDVSLLDVNATLKDIERERRRIIEHQTVRVKKINCWVKNENLPDDTPDDLLEMENVSSVEEELPSSTVPDIVVSVEGPESERKFSTSDADVATCTSDNKTPDGEVVYDSIIQNKHKTKNYWEQLMMAATVSEQQRAAFKRELLSLGSDGEDGKPSSDVSEQEYYDARSQISLHSPAEPLDSLDQTYDFVGSGPKIVETVAKKLMETETVKLNKSVGEESFIEMDIRLQREREAALAREREEAILRAAAMSSAQVIENSPPVITVSPVPTSTPIPNSAETKIALELREMKEREEELRRLRQRLNKDEPDDGFNSIPNTDEGNFSEYGSEEKELSLDGNNSRMMSPEVLAGPGSFLHQRTQSMDSMSSGHSSGSGSGSGQPDVTASRRRITVKPLDEPDDEEIPGYTLRNQKETPIEREIRLAREREEELRKEKGLPPVSQTSPATTKEVRRINTKNTISNDTRSLQHRLATSRIQQEIDEATEREKELREAGMIQTMSEDTVDSKVTRFTELAEFAIEKQDRKLKKSVSVSHIPQSRDEIDMEDSISPISVQKIQNSNGSVRTEGTFGRSMSQSPSAPTLSPRKFPSGGGQKGLMQRFLATRGKMGTLSTGYVTEKTSPSQTPVPVPVPPVTDNKLSDTPVVERKQKSQEIEEKENDDVQRAFRRGYITAGEKIQVEMQEMQKREEELRLQRALSQPNLLCREDGDEEDGPITNGNEENHAPLRGALSNPHLLDMDTIPHNDSDLTLDKPSKTIRKRSALIAQWENMIQQNIEH